MNNREGIFSYYRLKNAEIIKEKNNTYLSLTGEFKDYDTIKIITIPKILLSDDNITINYKNDDIFATDYQIEFKIPDKDWRLKF